MKKGQGRKDFIFIFLTGVIWLTGIALRLYQLTDIPAGMHVDEAGMAYDAWCLGEFGTDRFLNRWPVYLINYGSGQSAMYAYLTMLFMKLGGITLWMIRMPAFLSGCAVMIFGTLIADRCFRRSPGRGEWSGKWAVVLTALLLAVGPYFIMASRMGFDCNLMLGFSTVTMYVLLCAVESGNLRGFVGAGVMMGLTLYTYSLAWMVLPFFLIFALLYLWRQQKLSVKKLAAVGIPVFGLALPLLLFVAVNKLQLESMRILWFTVPRIPYFRTDHFQMANIAENIGILRKLLTTDQYTFNAVKPYGTLYPVSIPFVAVGIGLGTGILIYSIWKREYNGGCLVVLWFWAQMLTALITKEPDIYRTNGIYFSLVFLAVLTMRGMMEQAARIIDGVSRTPQSRERVKGRMAAAVHLAGAVFAALYVVCGVSFARYYFGQYTKDYPVQWFINDYVDEIMEVFRDADPGQKIYFDNYNCSVYAYDCLIRRVSPYDWNRENDMFTQEENLGNRHYYLPEPDQIEEDAWYVVMDDSGFGANLEARGFQWNVYGYYKVYFKP